MTSNFELLLLPTAFLGQHPTRLDTYTTMIEKHKRPNPVVEIDGCPCESLTSRRRSR